MKELYQIRRAHDKRGERSDNKIQKLCRQTSGKVKSSGKGIVASAARILGSSSGNKEFFLGNASKHFIQPLDAFKHMKKPLNVSVHTINHTSYISLRTL